MRVVLKKAREFDKISYEKYAEFTLKGITWGPTIGEKFTILSTKGKEHFEDRDYFDYDVRDTKR